MNYELSMLEMVEDSFATYAAMTIQDRALVDARDCLKPAQRQCMYSLLINKYVHKKPFVKSIECVGSAMKDFYVHGDAACYDLLARMARPYNLRYPLMDFKGQYGPISTGRASSPRYTDMRLGELGGYLFDNVDSNCIDVWFDNYSNTKQFPSVVPSLGYYNICNGTEGIATSMSSSIPSFNVKEVNEAMIKLLWNPDIDFDEIYCPPDFGIGGTILNADAVKEILRYGGGEAVKGMKFNGKKLGSSVRMRATATLVEDERAIYFTEVPYGVYTQTIVEQIVAKMNSGEIVGIAKDGIKDLSKKTANIKIIYDKGVNPTMLIKKLYKLTDLDSCYSINMLMLDKGVKPRLFSWKEALQAHIDHEIDVRTKIHKHEIEQINARVNIIDGLLLAIANIDEVVNIIRNSDDKEDAKSRLIARFGFNEPQTEAILKMSLSKLINLEITSFKNEKDKLLVERQKHMDTLENKELLFKEIEADMRKVADKIGDERKTKLMNFDFSSEEDKAEPIEKKELIIHYTNLGNLYTQISSTLVAKRRGAAGSKLKLKDNEVIVQSISDTNCSSLLAFSNKGKMYNVATNSLPIDTKINIASLFELEPGEKITTVTSFVQKKKVGYFIFVTKNGMVKKTSALEYKSALSRSRAIQAIKLNSGDEVIDVHFIDNEPLGILTSTRKFVIINTEDITAIGRTCAGIHGIKLKTDDEVITSQIIKNKYMITVSAEGLIKKTSMDEYPICSRNTIGQNIAGVRGEDKIVGFLTLDEDCDIIIISNKGVVKINTSDITATGRSATGVKAMKLPDGAKIVDVIKA